jgi:AcrR family transcriptional regulator
VEDQVPNRRARLRAEATSEIKAIALKLMAQGGPDAISLRAIAREMGMTAGALYGYFPTRDALITALITEVYTSFVMTAEAARDAVPADDSAGRLLAWAEAFRQWALANPEGFRLIYGDPVPGYQPPDGGPAAEAERRACMGLTTLVAATWSYAERLQPASGHHWADFDPRLVTEVRTSLPHLPPAGIALAMRVWGRLHGLVSLEIYGHLSPLTTGPAKLYRAEMLDLIRSLGLTPPGAEGTAAASGPAAGHLPPRRT